MTDYQDSITPAIQRSLDLLGNVTPILEEFAVWQDGTTDDLFRNEVDPYGKAWEDLKPHTWTQKHKKGSINKKLQFTGKMRASVVSQVQGNKFRHGFADKKAVFHDRGTRKMPKRQLLPDSRKGLPPSTEKELGDIALRYILKELKEK